jgi:hypothetical protein
VDQWRMLLQKMIFTRVLFVLGVLGVPLVLSVPPRWNANLPMGPVRSPAFTQPFVAPPSGGNLFLLFLLLLLLFLLLLLLLLFL